MPATATDRLAGLTTSVAIKPACVAVATFSFQLSGLFTLNGVTLEEGDRVLVTGQSNAVDNGIYNASTSDWTRALDFDGPRDVVSGTLVSVYNGLVEGVLYEVITLGQIIIGETPINFRLQDDPNITYGQTQAEIIAGVVPVNHSFPPAYVDRYGTNIIPGTTSMTAAFQAAINVAKRSAQTVKYGATWPYLLDAPLDLTTGPSSSPTSNGFTIHCDAQPLANTTNPPYCPSIIAKHTGHVFDCTGTYGINFENVTVTTDVITYPKTCFFFARGADGNSQLVRLNNCQILGWFSKAVLYNFGSENFVAVGCYFYNASTAVGTKTVVLTSRNILGLTSSFQTLDSVASCIDHTFLGCQFLNSSLDLAADLIYLDAVGTPRFLGCWAYMNTGRAMFYVDGTNGPTQNLVIRDWLTESISLQQYFVTASNHAVVHSGWKIDNVTSYSANSWFQTGGPLPTIDELNVLHFQDITNHGLSISGQLQYSVIYTLNAVTIGTSVANELHGDPSRFTITTRNADSWYQFGASALSWTPGTGAITHGGTLTVSSKGIAYLGRQVIANFSLKDTVSMSWAANTAITGLPSPCLFGRGMVTVVDVTTGVTVGLGYVNGTSIFLPALAAGGTDEIAITATYFGCAP